jgi:hypothetical protein
LFALYLASPPPGGQAARTEVSIEMDRAATGFARGSLMQFDLDGDGVPDLAVWEGEGAQGGTATTDERWYRLALVNVGGRWKVLGSDVFAYGGCGR